MRVDTRGDLSSENGYFAFRDAVCYGRLSDRRPSVHAEDSLADAFDGVEIDNSRVRLPFELSEVVTNIRREQYLQNGCRFLDRVTSGPAAQRALLHAADARVGVATPRSLERWSVSCSRAGLDVSVDALLRHVRFVCVKST